MISHRKSESSFFFFFQVEGKSFHDLKGNHSIVLFFQRSDEMPILRNLEGLNKQS